MESQPDRELVERIALVLGDGDPDPAWHPTARALIALVRRRDRATSLEELLATVADCAGIFEISFARDDAGAGWGGPWYASLNDPNSCLIAEGAGTTPGEALLAARRQFEQRGGCP